MCAVPIRHTKWLNSPCIKALFPYFAREPAHFCGQYSIFWLLLPLLPLLPLLTKLFMEHRAQIRVAKSMKFFLDKPCPLDNLQNAQ